MRSVLNESQITPFGHWIRQYLRSSGDGLSVTNLDYVFEDFRARKLLLLEEKQSGGHLQHAQKLTFAVIDQCARGMAERLGYDYWGFFVLTFPSGTTMPGPGMRLNGHLITAEQLQAHLNFQQRFCAPLTFDRGDEHVSRGSQTAVS